MAIKPFNSVGGFSVGESPANVILANGDITTSNANLSANLYVTNTANVGNLRTDNILYANGTPWDFQEAAGNTWQIQYNVANNFAASANFTYDDSIQNLVILGNANVTKTFFGNIGSFTGNISALNANLGNLATANYVNVSNEINGNIANFSGNLTSLNANLGNLATANYVNVSSNITVTNLVANTNVNFSSAGNVTLGPVGNLHITGGSPDQILKTDGNGNLSWSSGTSLANGFSNVTIPNANGNVYINANAGVDQQWVFGTDGNLTGPAGGLADLGNLVIANFANIASNTTTSNLSVNLELSGNTANFTGNITASNANLGNLATANFANISSNLNVTNTANVGNLRTDNLLYANGQPWDLQEAAGANTQVQYNDGNNDFAASANFTYDQVASNLTVIGNVIATNFVGNISGNITAPGANTEIIFNDANVANAVANFSYDKAYNSGGGELNVGNTVGGQIITDNVYASYGNVGNLDVITDITAGGNISTTGSGGNLTMTGGDITGVDNISANSANYTANVISNNLTVNLELSGNTANFTGNINSALNANLGNLVTANFVNVASNITTSNLSVNTSLSGNTANFSGNVISNNLTVNLELSGNTANFTGNIIAANIVGALANGTSNVKVYNDANVEFTINGNANVATITSTGLYVVGEINTTAGNMLSNGNITANGFLNSANANITGEMEAGSVKTANIIAPVGDITISATGANSSIYFVPTGNGAVDVGLFRVAQVGDPTQPHDAATKEYVDNIAQGLSIHPPVRVTSTTNLNATYNDGGTALTTTTISGGKTITFSANHGLSVGDEIYWTNSFNGIIGSDAYFVYSTPALNQITVKAGFFGAEVTTLTNATGLTQAALGNPGVGATLTNAGANAAISIDSISLSSTNRVLVQGQTNQFENGIYDVTTVGNGSTAWVLTRSVNEDQYDPKSTTGLAYGDYFFVEEGTNAAGSSYVLTSPTGEIVFGITNIGFSQFSASGSYSAGNGIAITGTIISANVDLVTTDIVGGNIVVKASANLTTPNLGDATFSSLSWNNLSNGNVTANNLSIGNIANITGNLRVDGVIQANGNISSNANINGNNAFFTNLLDVGGNLLANNITSNNAFSTNTANISSNLVTSNATVNLELSGNTANFSGNVILPNLTVNLALAGNTANFTGNIVALNANAGNLLTANFANIVSNTTTSNLTVNLELSGNTANFSGNVILPNLTVNTSLSGNTANFSGNVVVPNLTVNLALAGNTANFSGNVVALNTNAGNLLTANFANIASNVTTSNLAVNLALSGNTANFSGNITSLNANLGNLATANYFTGTLINGTSNVAIPSSNGNINLTAGGNTSLVVTNTGANITGNLGVSGNFSVGSLVSENLTANLNVFVGNTTISWGTVTTNTITSNQTIASLNVTSVTGLEFLVKGIDTTGAKYSVATVQAVTDGANVDYATFATVNLGGTTGSFVVNVVSGNIELQVTPASSNSTLWTTQVRFI